MFPKNSDHNKQSKAKTHYVGKLKNNSAATMIFTRKGMQNIPNSSLLKNSMIKHLFFFLLLSCHPIKKTYFKNISQLTTMLYFFKGQLQKQKVTLFSSIGTALASHSSRMSHKDSTSHHIIDSFLNSSAFSPHP